MRNKTYRILLPLLIVIAFMFTCTASFAATEAKITKQPVSVTVSKGTTAKIDIDATGDGLTYSWYYKDKGSKKFTRTTTFKKDKYSVKMSSKRAGRQVYCIVKDKYGNKVQTKTATLSMGTTLKFTRQLKSVSALKGDEARAWLKASGDGLTYKWYYKNKGDKKFTRTTTFKGRAYYVPMNSSRDGRQVYCIVTDKYGSQIRSSTVTLSLIPVAKVTKQPESATAGNGEQAKVTLTAVGRGLKYEWYYKNYGSSSFKRTSTFTGNTYTAEMNKDRHGRQIYCKVTDKYGNTAKSKVATLYLEGAVPGNQPITNNCEACAANAVPLDFGYNDRYTQANKLESLPVTFEAVIQIDKDDLNTSKMMSLDSRAKYKETVLFSNDDTFESSVTISITDDGNPKIGLRHKDWYRKSHNFVFDDISVFSADPVHFAITYDQTTDKVNCYVNGQLRQTLSDIPSDVKKAFTTSFNYAVGGDLYNGNSNYFRGNLYSLSVWSDVRSDKEIYNDYFDGISSDDNNLMASYYLMGCDDCILKDYSAKDNNLVIEHLWNSKDSIAPVEEYDYSFAVLGDTQELSEDYPEGLDKLYQWIVDNKSAHKIEYVLGLGDITQKSYDYEWEYAQKQIYRMNDVVPYLLAKGNHDYDTVENGIVTAGFSKTFNDGIYNDQLSGVMTRGKVENAYRTINICGIDYLFLALDFGPNAEMLDWASSVIDTYSDHRVVIITHGYMYRDGTTLDKTDAYPASTHPLRDRKAEQAEKPSLDGDQMWTQFVSKHSNIQLVLSGHDPCQHIVYRQDKGDHGNTVTQMLIDPQHIDGFYTPTAMVAMFYFSDNGNTLTVRYYSVLKDSYGSERSQFTISLN